jgi:hypothetical protein
MFSSVEMKYLNIIYKINIVEGGQIIMDRYPAWLYKILIVGVIFLFVGIAVQPSIATVQQEEINDRYYDLTIELVGLGKKYTVQLTKQQIEKLEIVFESIKKQLDNVQTKEATIQIYDDAILEMNKNGLFGDYSVRQVQRLINREYQKSISNLNMKGFFNKIKSNNSNFLCLVAGKTTNTFVLPPGALLFWRFLTLFDDFIKNPFFGINLIVRVGLCWFTPMSFGYLFLGHRKINGNMEENIPSNGWIHTFGLLGKKNWNESFYGQLILNMWIYDFIYFLGASGFKGITIYNNEYLEYLYFLGFARTINIGSNPP